MGKQVEVEVGGAYHVKNHDGTFIVKGFTFLFGSPAVNVKKKKKNDFRVVRVGDLIPIDKK